MFEQPPRSFWEHRLPEPSVKQANTKKYSAPMLVVENNELVVKKGK